MTFLTGLHIVMRRCPECGEEEKYNSYICDNCSYIYRFDDRANYDAEDLVFTVKFECKNCGRKFKHGFAEGDEVYAKNSMYEDFELKLVSGHPYLGKVNDGRCKFQCPTCGIDHSLLEVDRIPVQEA
ncbi:hypothetical protein PNQ29_11280 [Halobacterium salinarum]|uniref:hypothetical protein n=1 Tax=Halobacterium salinarum TaxID=2242 RepID=UPI002554EE25|nr:hypothetical protein [Halobacterium salinarum]MDL0120301.1 hypothetical protein [Halobacterium salinarum]